MTDLIHQVAKYVYRVPIVVLRLGKDLSGSLWKSQKRLDWFSFTERHEHFNNMKSRRPTLCLLEAQGEDKKAHCYLGVMRSKQSVSTADSRLVLEEMVEIGTGSMRGTVGAFLKNQDNHIKSAWKEALQVGKISTLTPKLSVCLTGLLAKNPENREDVKKVFSCLMGRFGGALWSWAQQDALDTALSVFRLKKHEVEYQETRLLEDSVIAHDAAKLPGFKAVAPNMTGRYTHTLTTPDGKGKERVVIYVANRTLLEDMVGVDLIYINDTTGNIVMVQYKMLDQEMGGEWVFRPGKNFWKQVERMRIPACKEEKTDYRLHSNPFFFKFMRRKSSEVTPTSFVLSLDHLEQYFKSQQAKGALGGLRLTYKSLRGVYLRHSDMVGLLRSGYIGTHRAETEALAIIFDQVAKGNKRIVVAWKDQLSSSDED